METVTMADHPFLLSFELDVRQISILAPALFTVRAGMTVEGIMTATALARKSVKMDGQILGPTASHVSGQFEGEIFHSLPSVHFPFPCIYGYTAMKNVLFLLHHNFNDIASNDTIYLRLLLLVN